MNALRSFIRLFDVDIVFLQEVNLTIAPIPGYESRINPSERGRGTAIIYREGMNVSHFEMNNDGRIIKATLNNEVTLCNVYAPAGTQSYQERKVFFQTEVPHFLSGVSDLIILGGDFNATIDGDGRYGGVFCPALRDLVSALSLEDVWLTGCHREVGYTLQKGGANTRPDKIYVSSSEKARIQHSSVHPVCFSDHHAFLARVRLPGPGPPRRKGIWSLSMNVMTPLWSRSLRRSGIT
jgi:endonuclease/exonuclease/phosphatase (EEP) superfamily protein YafD